MTRSTRRPLHSIFEAADTGMPHPTPEQRASGPIFTNPRFEQGSTKETH